MNDDQRTRLNPGQQTLERDLRAYAVRLAPPGWRYGTLAALDHADQMARLGSDLRGHGDALDRHR
ncbi:hypothetical protein [Nonomuraea longicatena]|uniref:Uncharacterized protein n=1 Tax=Nonomuraea longicatena TaxID=83682 RepID=A0ABP4BTS1_9ACTN